MNLKYFSLTSRDETFVYNQVLIPHLHRMSNLEKLILNISIEGEEKFLDGNNLKKNIINHMLRLRQFLFHIRSIVVFDNLMHLPVKRRYSTYIDKLLRPSSHFLC